MIQSTVALPTRPTIWRQPSRNRRQASTNPLVHLLNNLSWRTDALAVHLEGLFSGQMNRNCNPEGCDPVRRIPALYSGGLQFYVHSLRPSTRTKGKRLRFGHDPFLQFVLFTNLFYHFMVIFCVSPLAKQVSYRRFGATYRTHLQSEHGSCACSSSWEETAVSVIWFQLNRHQGPGSVLDTTGYGLDGPGIESRWGTRFPAPVHTGPGAYPASSIMGTGSFPEVKSGRNVKLILHPF